MSDEATAPAELPDDIAAQMAAALAAQKAREEAAAAEAAAREAAEAEAAAQEAAAIRAAMAAAHAAADAKAEAEGKAAADALAASLAALQAGNADAVPTLFPVDVVSAPLNKAGVAQFGPSFAGELQAAGLVGLPFAVSGDHVTFDLKIDPAIRARVVAVIEAHNPDASSTPDLAAYAKDARDAKENGGITVQGVPIATDDRSKLLVAGARMRAEDNPNGTEMWAAADGREYPLPSAAIVLISKAIGAHVSACFVCYASVKAALSASPPTITDQAGVDAAFAAVSTAY